jgi:hypothetical protein
MLTTDQWEFGLAAWIIQDGNYGEFERGQIADFAIEFYAPNLGVVPKGPLRVERMHSGKYSITAEVTFVAERVHVLDFGLQVYRHGEIKTMPPRLPPGSVVAADEVYLGIDPFFYFEDLFREPGIPPLIYTWRIEQILMQTAPFIPGPERAPNGTPIMVRDSSRIGWREVPGTNAWADDGGNAEYLLRCTRLPDAPKYRLGVCA